MPLYEGRTLKEAMRKAIRGEDIDTRTLTGRVPSIDAEECAWIAVALKKLDHEFATLEQEARRQRSRMGQLQLDAVIQSGILTAELVAMSIPISRIVRARSIIRSALAAIRNGLQTNPFRTVAVLLAEAIGVFDVVNRVQRISEDVLEIGHIVHELREMRATMERVQSESESMANKFDGNNCALHPELPTS